MPKKVESNDDIDRCARFRHEARTFLNHAIGYAELFPDKGAAGFTDAFIKSLGRLRTAVQDSRSSVLDYLEYLDSGGQDDDSTRQQAYARIYDLIESIQAARNSAPPLDGMTAGVLEDVRRVYQAVNSLVDLLGEREKRGDFIPDSSPAAASMGEKPAKRTGRVLIIDDNQFNRDLLSRHLERQGHIVCQAPDGIEAFRILGQAPFDIVFLDVMMPGMNGFQFLETIRADRALREMSIIVISALEDTTSMARCLELGAEDYLPRDFDPILLKARMDSILEKKEYKRQNEQTSQRLADTQAILAAELQGAADYVRGLLPKRAHWADLAVDWEFIPSLSLGGDIFSYWRLPGRRLAVFLIDVSGHGIEAALLSVTVMNLLKTTSLVGADFGSPASVLSLLNRSFRVEDQNNMFFTIWYGVYDPAIRSLIYATAGTPPAILVRPDASLEELVSDGPLIGVDEGARFTEIEVTIEAGSHFYLFSDGLFEIRKKDGTLLPWEEFLELLATHHRECALAPSGLSPIKRIVDTVLSLSSKKLFDDDVSIVEFAFHG